MPRKLYMQKILSVVGIIIVDQITKLLIRANMAVGDEIPVIGNLLTIRYIQNTGVAFGMFENSRWIVTVFQIIVILIVLATLVKFPKLTGHSNVALLMILAGGIGNLIDRILLGYVTDMISISFFPPVFNVADIAVTLGCFILILELVLDIKNEN